MDDRVMQATAKINAIMQKNADDLYTEIIGHYCIERAADCPEKILNAKKTLDGAMTAIMVEAGKRRKAGDGKAVAMVHTEVFAVVDRYFGFPRDLRAQSAAMQGGAAAPESVSSTSEPSGALRLEDFF